MNIEGIVLVRIDDRLIHGQVMTSWLNYTGANKIMIIDDGVAADPFMKSVLKTCVPANVRLATFTIEKAAVRLKKGFAGDKCIVLVKYPETLYQLMKKGIVFDQINIGGMGVSGTRTKFFRNISASEEEKQMLKELVDAGSHISVRIIAEDSETDISKML
ncbi:MAG TPA: PTS sugar transporter subunit IIB [Candidatus Anaerostipes excrementavium]|uniref:PTS sugar transporter subunit IIB n=1 Tax=Candidatus Anaerostipes excrementavium TaxID=2838463 RepID=A0A9D1WTS6_9FIRM|nr:PTS sugar transporter subunit IIB [uncultured Anaerostipes sp.]HIX66951.1 PTS sugar transporter subunit IIB [Candidatus Anaerostipes excrementavium]